MFLYAAFVLLMFSGCAKAAPDATLDRTTSPSVAPQQSPQKQMAKVIVSTAAPAATFTVELATTDAQRERGLMYREKMADDAGMLFIFDKEKKLSFWMKNTHIPLDMIFIAEDGTIAGIVEDAEPMTLTSRHIDQPSRYVLEINSGLSRTRGIKTGQRVRFVGVDSALVDVRTLQ